jgi:hypothetical protein
VIEEQGCGRYAGCLAGTIEAGLGGHRGLLSLQRPGFSDDYPRSVGRCDSIEDDMCHGRIWIAAKIVDMPMPSEIIP